MALLNKRLHTQVSEDEEVTIKAAADSEGRTVSSFIRRSVLNSLATQNNAKPASEEPGYGQMIAKRPRPFERTDVTPIPKAKS